MDEAKDKHSKSIDTKGQEIPGCEHISNRHTYSTKIRGKNILPHECL
jgi:hypothetical protein